MEAQKASVNASAPQHIRGGHGPTGKCQTEPVAVDARTDAGIDIARARAQPVDGRTDTRADRQTRPDQTTAGRNFGASRPASSSALRV